MLGINKCRRYRNWMWEQSLGRLDASQAEELRRHLGRCDACAREATDVHRAAELLLTGRGAASGTGAGDWPLIAARLDATPLPSMPRRRRAPRLALAGAALAALVLGLTWRPWEHRPIAPRQPGGIRVARDNDADTKGTTPDDTVKKPPRPLPATARPKPAAKPRPAAKARAEDAPTTRRRGPWHQVRLCKNTVPAPPRTAGHMQAPGPRPGSPAGALVVGSAVPPPGPAARQNFVMGSIPSMGATRVSTASPQDMTENQIW